MTFRKRSKTFYILCLFLIITACYGISLFRDKTAISRHFDKNAGERTLQTARPESNWGIMKMLPAAFVGVNASSNNKPSPIKSANQYTGESGKRSLLVPSDAELAKMDEQKMRQFYWKYINTIQVLCRNQTRLGSFKDGGKEVCVDIEYLPPKPCLVYSFGSNFQFDFEQAVINAFGCEVHTFDPTVNLNQRGKKVPGNVHFYLKGLDGRDYVTSKKWQMATLETIMKELNHTERKIDLLKIDIEGSEWNAIAQMVKVGTLRLAKQLLLEVHFANANRAGNWGGVSSLEQLKSLRALYEAGFRIFMREHNLYSLQAFRSQYNTQYTNVNEISLINVNYAT